MSCSSGRGSVPHGLSIWGLTGGFGVVTYRLLGILGFDTGMGSPYMLLAMPLAIQGIGVRGLAPRQGVPDGRSAASADTGTTSGCGCLTCIKAEGWHVSGSSAPDRKGEWRE